MDFAIVVILVVIAVILFGILTAVKAGFNEIIHGLEALERRSA